VTKGVLIIMRALDEMYGDRVSGTGHTAFRHAADGEAAEMFSAPDRQVKRRRPPPRTAQEAIPIPTPVFGWVRTRPGCPPRGDRLLIRLREAEGCADESCLHCLVLDEVVRLLSQAGVVLLGQPEGYVRHRRRSART
jgi:hypothetical protein